MSKSVGNASMSNNKSYGSIIRINMMRECFCKDEHVLCTVSDMNNIHNGKKFWIERQKKKNLKLKDGVV